MSKHIDIMMQPTCPYYKCTCSIKFSEFYLVEGWSYVRLSEISHFSKCENDVITWRKENFRLETQLVVGWQKKPLYAKKSDLETVQFLQSNLNMQTTIYKYI